MQTGENEQGLRQVIDLTRMVSIVLLLLHFYYSCYSAFNQWQIRSSITDKLLQNIYHTGLFSSFYKCKLIALLFLTISLVGAKGRKDEHINYRNAIGYICIGTTVFFGSFLLFYGRFTNVTMAIIYMVITTMGYTLILTGGTYLSRIIQQHLGNNVFNSLNETFPQEERLLDNDFSINLPAKYNLKGKIRKSWINIINPFRGVLVMGSPGSGKSYFVIQHIIKQHIQKSFSMFVYDFKFDDLTKIAYN